MKILIACYLLWNLITFSMMGIDKYKAQHDKWRISEGTLLTGAFLMGGVGSLMGSHVFHHKTKKLKFKVLLPLAVVCNCGIIYFFIFSENLTMFQIR